MPQDLIYAKSALVEVITLCIHPTEGNFTENAQNIYPSYQFEMINLRL